jgi:hypothetical protein
MHRNRRILLLIVLLAVFTVCAGIFGDIMKSFWEGFLSGEETVTSAETAQYPDGTADHEHSEAADDMTTQTEETHSTQAASAQTASEEETEVQGDEKLSSVSSEELDSLAAQQSGSYAYSCISDAEKKVYLQMEAAMLGHKGSVVLSTLDTETVTHAFDCVMMDHPEIFYTDGYKYIKYTLGGKLKKIAFSPQYTMNESETAAKQAEVDSYVNTCLAGMPQGTDDYQKIRYVYEYIINNTDYQADAEDNQNICSVFIGKKSVCQGYAKATQYLLEKTGISCTTVDGTADGGPHAWDLVKADGEYYYVDTTWGDANYQKSQGGREGTGNTINYDYLCASTADITRTHTLDDTVALPVCTADTDNYYVREGLYFTSVDRDQLGKVFDSAYSSGMKAVSIKCSSTQVYDDMHKYLIDDQKIFRYLRDSGSSATYIDSADTDSFTFWLQG